MLTPGDAAVAARDRQLPGLALVLDPDRLAERLAGLVPAGVRRLHPTYVRYKPGTSCVLGFDVDSGTGPLPGYAKTVRHGQRHKLDKLVAKATRGQGRGAVVLEDMPVALTLFPHDAKLPAVRRLGRDGGEAQLLRKLLPGANGDGPGRLVPLRYKPERRFVSRLDRASGGPLVLKAYDVHDYPGARAGAAMFRSTGQVTVAVRAMCSTRHQVLAAEWLDGPVLFDQLCAGDVDVAPVGAALRALHRQAPRDAPELSPAAQARDVLAAGRMASLLLPDEARAVRSLATRVAGELQHARDGGTPVHGDFSADQVVLSDPVGIIDFDGAGVGDAAADLGTFAANLDAHVLAGHLPGDRAGRAMAGLLAGYGPDGWDRDRLTTYRAARLLRLVTRPFRYRDAGWPDLAARTLAFTRDLLA